MLKFVDTKVVFQEIPDEVTLAINISNCPCHCEDCHSSYLAEDIGETLTTDKLRKLIDNNKGISCVAFMGGDSDPNIVCLFAMYIKNEYPHLKVGWYSGRTEVYEPSLLRYRKYFNYIKDYDLDVKILSQEEIDRIIKLVTSSEKTSSKGTFRFTFFVATSCGTPI